MSDDDRPAARLIPRLPSPPLTVYPDRDSEPYWRALAEGAFRLQRCSACGALRWPPREICNRCHSFENAWTEVARSGRVVSWTRTHQVFAPACKDIVPFFTVQVALTEQDDILMIGGWLVDRAPRASETVELQLVETEDGGRLPCWKPIAGV